MIALLVLVLLVVVALELNQRRQQYPRDVRQSRTCGPDRDLDRLLDDLRSAAARSRGDW